MKSPIILFIQLVFLIILVIGKIDEKKSNNIWVYFEMTETYSKIAFYLSVY